MSDDVGNAAAHHRSRNVAVAHVVRTLIDAFAQVLQSLLAESFGKAPIAICLMLRTGHQQVYVSIVVS